MKLAGTKDIAMIMKIAIITSVPPSLKNKRYNDTCKLHTQRTYEFFYSRIVLYSSKNEHQNVYEWSNHKRKYEFLYSRINQI